MYAKNAECIRLLVLYRDGFILPLTEISGGVIRRFCYRLRI